MKIAIASGKGGTGKTFVSTNLFYTAQLENIEVTLIDCDAEEPNVLEFISGEILNTQPVFQKIPVIDIYTCEFCGKCQEYCSYNAIICLPKSGFIKVIEELCHDCGACTEACEIDAISEKDKQIGEIRTFKYNNHSNIIEAQVNIGVHSPVPLIKKAIQGANPSSLILLDSPPGISCPFIATVEQADYVVLVTEPTPFGLNDLKLSVETLQEIGKPFGVVINRAGLGNQDVHSWMEEQQINLLLEIPFDKEIARVYAEGQILSKEHPEYQNLFRELLTNIKKQIAYV